ncbi:MAG: hypothetical protein KatS3mg105_3949 [Gemmatales bacterium]|nr:MAG: hypothetical protein KatS3mg105_3949 [Gemmatales bacterium]
MTRMIGIIQLMAFLGLPDIQTVIINLGIVVGAAVLGAIFANYVVLFAYRGLGRNDVHDPVKTLSRTIGALVAGVLVFLLLFGLGLGPGMGGNGWFFGSSSGQNASTDNSKDKNQTDAKNQKKQPDEIVPIHILGGERVVEDRNYVLGNGKPCNLETLKREVLKLKEEQPNFKTIDIILYDDSVTSESEVVGKLRDWADRQGFEIKETRRKTLAPKFD